MTPPSTINSFFRRLGRPTREDRPPEPEHNAIGQNIDTILAFYQRGEQKINRSQRSIEYISGLMGRPMFLGSILLFVPLWVGLNTVAATRDGRALDSPPYAWLQGFISLAGLLTSTVVLIRQNRMSKLEAHRAHLDLQVNLLTEQKVTKIINLLAELRRDLPMVKDLEDPELAALQQPTDAEAMLAAIQEWREADVVVEVMVNPEDTETDLPIPMG